MPLGTRHEITGLLVQQGASLSLFPLAGGCWRLDTDRPARELAGRRVTVVGVRAGFDLLDVESIRPAGAPPPPRSWWRRLLL